jgi:hypothetical protein
MKLIAHRGLLKGPSELLENHPKQIAATLAQGYDCEIDVWYIDNTWMLGHDLPRYIVSDDFLSQPGLWIHAKNLEALYVLGADSRLNFFWHQEDDFTLTSQGYIWAYPGKKLTDNSVCVMPEWNDPEFKTLDLNCYGICSDRIKEIKELI